MQKECAIFIPARGGSKGLKNKNLKLFASKPLVYWSVAQAKKTKFKNDIDSSIKIFIENIGYNPLFFSYPFGEYSSEQEKYISSKFDFAFGQHSGLIDINKDKYELPRFPINEKYGDLKRFTFLLNMKRNLNEWNNGLCM